jgi:WD40 repeat protein
MEQIIVNSTKPRDQKLGQMILTWAVCSRRPLLLKELSQALQPEFSIMTDLSHIINRVCGQFVAIDSTDRLVMIHQTARDHIIATRSVLAVKVSEGHEKLFTKCLLVLENKQPRRHADRRGGTTKLPDYQEFLRYATVSWNYHLNLLSSESDAPLVLLAKFLSSTAVLNWIESLAKKNLLKVLVYSSKAMTSYARRKRHRNTETNPLQHRIQEIDLVESWAIDFLKIIGKFGPNLIAAPASIYHQIPPFCPENSALFKHYEHSTPKPHSLVISGIDRKDWDDNLARIALGSGTQALIVAAAGNHIAVASASGQTTLYNAATFEVRRVFRHTENISAMSFSDCTKLLATYGYNTTKVWSVETGLVLQEIPNPQRSRAFTIAFAGGDTELIIGSNDRLIRIADLTVSCPGWIVLHPALLKDDAVLDRPVHKVPWRIAFSPDRNYVAVAYRNFPLSVWSLDDDRPELVGRLMRDEKYAGNSWTVVDQVIWHAGGQNVVGLYMGGHVFRWDPFQNTQQELQAEASILACSPEGKFFAIGTSDGTIKLYDFHHFALVYQLSCDSMINDFCFSPDGKRIYDVRGQYCNVWEPNALIRHDDGGEQDSEERSEVASIPTLAVSEAFADARDQITATAIQYQGRYQALGNESGSISIIDTSAKAPRPIQIWQASIPLAIGFLAWSDDGRYLACSELTGRVVVKNVQRTPEDSWKITPVFDMKVSANSEGLQQLLMNNDGSLLMVKNGSTAAVWPVGQAAGLECGYTAIESPNTKWIKHPSDPRALIAFDCTHIYLHRWNDLSETAVVSLMSAPFQASSLASASDDSEENRLVGVFADPAGSHCIIDVLHPTSSSSKRITSVFTITNLEQSTAVNLPLKLEAIPDELQQEIEILVGVLPRQRLVFLDKNFWMCSLLLNQPLTRASVQRHYYLPKDWLNARYLDHCAILRDGKFLVPNNGELAIVACTELSAH